MSVIRGLRRRLIFFCCYVCICLRGVHPSPLNWSLSACPQPAPVPNAFRDVSSVYDVTYSCYDGYADVSGDLRRRCLSAGHYYSGAAPRCVMTCQTPLPERWMYIMPTGELALAGDTTKTVCMMGTIYGGPSHITCSEELGQWEPLKLFCCRSVTLKKVQPSSSGRSGNCKWTTEAEERPYLTATFSTSDPLDVYDVSAVLLVIGASSKDHNVVITVDVLGDSVLPCGQFTPSLTSRQTGLECQLVKGSLPWGHGVKVTAVFPGAESRALEVCKVSVYGRPHSGQCSFPPTIPRLEVRTEVTTFHTNDTVVYSCSHRLLPLAGSGLSRCSPFREWSYPSLVCTDETNLASGMPVTVMTSPGSWLAKPGVGKLTDDDVSTGLRHDPVDVIYRVNLTSLMEIRTVVLSMSGSLQFNVKTFSSATGNSRPCDVTEPKGAELTSAECHWFLGDAVYLERNTSVLPHGNLTEIRVFGRMFDKPLGCLRTYNGTDYKGYVSKTTSGRPCLRWADAASGLPRFDPQSLPDESVADAANFCRNLKGEYSGVMCYVRDAQGRLIRERCDVPLCATHCRRRADGQDYRGNLGATDDGRACVSWNHPNIPFRRKEDFDWLSRGDGRSLGDEASGDWRNHSHCRNPGGSQSGLWCYTDADTLDYGFCHVMLCGTDELPGTSTPASVASATFLSSAVATLSTPSSAAGDVTRNPPQPASSDVSITPSQPASSDITPIPQRPQATNDVTRTPTQTASSDVMPAPQRPQATGDFMRTSSEPSSSDVTSTSQRPQATSDVTRTPWQPESSDVTLNPQRPLATGDVTSTVLPLAPSPAASDTNSFFTSSLLAAGDSFTLVSASMTEISHAFIETSEMEFLSATVSVVSQQSEFGSSDSSRASHATCCLQSSDVSSVGLCRNVPSCLSPAVSSPSNVLRNSASSIASPLSDGGDSASLIVSPFSDVQDSASLTVSPFSDMKNSLASPFSEIQNSASSAVTSSPFSDVQSSLYSTFNPFTDLQNSVSSMVSPRTYLQSTASSVRSFSSDLETEIISAFLSTGSPDLAVSPATGGVSTASIASGSEAEAFSTTAASPVSISPTTAGGVEEASRKKPMCPCSCAARGSGAEDGESLSSKLRDLRNALHVPTHNLSATIRGRTSAPDSRTSSAVAGIMGVILLGLLASLLAAADVISAVTYLMGVIKGRHNIKSVQ